MKPTAPSQFVRTTSCPASIILALLALLAFAQRAPAPLVFKPGIGWIYEPIQSATGQVDKVYFPFGIEVVINDRLILGSDLSERMQASADRLRGTYRNQPAVLRRMLEDLHRDTLEHLVDRALILEECERGPLGLDPEALRQDLAQEIRSRYGDTNTFLRALAARGMTPEDYRKRHDEEIIFQVRRQEELKKAPKPTDEKIQQFYAANSSRFDVPEQVKLRLIACNTSTGTGPSARKRVEDILAKLEQGALFADLAKTYSQESHAAVGGDRGWVQQSVLRKDLAEVAFSLKPGTHSGVIETPEVCYLLLVEDKRPARSKPFEEVREDIARSLSAQHGEAMVKAWLNGLRADAFIRYQGGTFDPSKDHAGEMIRKVEIKQLGFTTFSNAEIKSQLRSKEGEPVLKHHLDRDLRELYRSGAFFNLRVNGEPMDGGSKLTYLVIENPVLTDIKFTGNKKFSSSELLQKLRSITGERLDEWKLFEDSRQIQKVYQQAGDPKTTVRYVVKTDEQSGRGSVTFEVTEIPE